MGHFIWFYLSFLLKKLEKLKPTNYKIKEKEMIELIFFMGLFNQGTSQYDAIKKNLFYKNITFQVYTKIETNIR